MESEDELDDSSSSKLLTRTSIATDRTLQYATSLRRVAVDLFRVPTGAETPDDVGSYSNLYDEFMHPFGSLLLIDIRGFLRRHFKVGLAGIEQQIAWSIWVWR